MKTGIVLTYFILLINGKFISDLKSQLDISSLHVLFLFYDMQAC